MTTRWEFYGPSIVRRGTGIASDLIARALGSAAPRDSLTVGSVSTFDIDAFPPWLAVAFAGRQSPVAPDHRVVGLGLGIAIAHHVGQAQAATRTQPCSESQAKPGRKSVPPRPLSATRSGRSPEA